jgi:hypothetical protein
VTRQITKVICGTNEETLMTARDITNCLIKHSSICNVRTHYVLPNAFWGLNFRHEIDLLSVTTNGYATEIEIKINLQDIKADLKKRHNHESIKVKKLYFAFPETLYEKALKYIPEKAGIILISKDLYPTIKRKPIINKKARNFNDKEIFKMLHLTSMRYWKQYDGLTNMLNERTIQLEFDI